LSLGFRLRLSDAQTRRSDRTGPCCGWSLREIRNVGEISARYRTLPTTLAVHACSRVSIRNPRKLMACFLPFRPWLYPGLRVFRIPNHAGPVDGPHACPLLHLRATPVARSNARRPAAETRSILPPSRNSSRASVALQHTRTEKPFSALGLRPSVRTALPYRPKVPSPGFGYPLDGVSSSTHGNLFQFPTLMGFTLQGFVPTPRLYPGFPGPLRSCASLSNRTA
jgi:hypothetical protein